MELGRLILVHKSGPHHELVGGSIGLVAPSLDGLIGMLGAFVLQVAQVGLLVAQVQESLQGVMEMPWALKHLPWALLVHTGLDVGGGGTSGTPVAQLARPCAP